jgi:hypothetical protein
MANGTFFLATETLNTLKALNLEYCHSRPELIVMVRAGNH